MGISGSKVEDEQAEKKEVSAVFDLQDLYFDTEGNLRMGSGHRKTQMQKDKEMRALMELEDDEDLEADERLWYIMDAVWVADWFAYIHHQSETAPNPGPCRNERLLTPDFDLNKWVPRYRMIMANKKRVGDYRRVTRKTWEMYCELYPGSGPTITTTFKQDDNCLESGMYDTSGWEVDEFAMPPNPHKSAFPVRANGEVENALHLRDPSDEMEDKTVTKNLKAQIESTLSRSRNEEREKEKKRKKKRGSMSKKR